MKAVVGLVLVSAISSAYGMSSWRRIDRTPFDEGQYTITVSCTPTGSGGFAFQVTLHPKTGDLPKYVSAQLSKLTIARSEVEDIPKRALMLRQHGVDRTVAFKATRSELHRLAFEFREFGESNGHPMPSLSAYYFRLDQVPTSVATDPTARVGVFARALYANSIRGKDGNAYESVHSAALRYVKTTPRRRLAHDLRAVCAAYGLSSPEGAGAAYLMAMHGIDADANIDRLGTIRQDRLGATEVVECLPEALADIALRWRSVHALNHLVRMDTDGAISEERSMQLARILKADTDLLIAAIAPHRSLWPAFLKNLAYGVEETDTLSPEQTRQIANRKAKSAEGAARALYRKIAETFPLRPAAHA